MSVPHAEWLTVTRGRAPLLVSLPHTGTWLSEAIEARLVSLWRARKDADWWIDDLYGFAGALGATIVHTTVSRTVIDVNRDPSGRSLYPGQATTELCPTTTFDGEPLYKAGSEVADDEAPGRRASYFDPYHAALDIEISRLRQMHERVVVYDCHAIRSVIPRLFDGTLPVYNIGTSGGVTCAPSLQSGIVALCAASGSSHAVNGRFKGGYITRRLGDPSHGIHAVQMELACRGYLPERPGPVTEADWPPPFDEDYAAPARRVLQDIIEYCLKFARTAENLP